MPLIEMIEPENAAGELAAMYDRIAAMRGRVGAPHKMFSTSPALLRQQMEFIGYYVGHATLSQALLASIRLLVSQGEACRYCIDFNTSLLIERAGWSLEQVEAMRSDLERANLPEREIAMLRLAVKAVRNAHGVNADDLDAIREMGWNDGEILDAVNHGARMLAADVLLNTFKVEKE